MDEDENKSEFEHNQVYDGTSPNVYSISIRIPFVVVRTINIYFPNDDHSLTHGGNNAVTYAQLAGLYLKTGNWSGWFGGEMGTMAPDFINTLNIRAKLLLEGEQDRARREWNRALSGKSARKQLQKAREEIARLKEEHAIFKKRASIKKPDFWNWERSDDKDNPLKPFPKGWGLKEQVIRVGEERAQFRKLKLEAREKQVKTWNLLVKKRKDYYTLKKHLVDVFGVQRKEHIEELQKLIYEADEGNSKEAKKIFQEQLRTWVEPYALANNAVAALKDLAKSLRDDIVNALLGAKAPTLSQRTKSNRAGRGNYSDIPLNETGEFANSLKYEVV